MALVRHRSQGARLPDAAARGPVRPARAWTAPAWACARTCARAMCSPDMRGTVPIKHLSRNLEGDHALFEIPTDRKPACRLRLAPPAICGASPKCSAAAASWTACGILSPRDAARSRARSTPATCRTSSTRPRICAPGGRSPPAYIGLGFQVRGTAIVPPPVRHARQPRDLRQLRRGQHDDLGRSRSSMSASPRAAPG